MKIFPILFVLIVSGNMFAQKEIVIVDRGEEFDTNKDKSLRFNKNTSVYKFAPLNMITGEITFGYERKASLKGSLDMELGATVSNVGFGGNYHYLSPYNQRLSGMGFITGFGYRYYPLDRTEALNRFYVSPILRYKLYNFGEKDLSSNLPNIRGYNSAFSFLFNFGYQVWVSETFSLDFYAGLGLGYQEIKTHEVTNYYNDVNGWQYAWESNLQSGARYVFNAGIKVGIGTVNR